MSYDPVYMALRDSFDSTLINQAIDAIRYEITRPAVVFRPCVYVDGNMWCCLYGEDIMSGVVGFGETPEKAAAAFDLVWWRGKAVPSE